MYLMPIFLSLYLKVLEMKHSFTKATNETIEMSENDRKINVKATNGTQIQPKLLNSTTTIDTNKNEALFDDEPYIWEEFATKAIVLFPHSPFCDAAILCFADNPMSDVIWKYINQVLDVILLITIVTMIENYRVTYTGIKNLILQKRAKD